MTTTTTKSKDLMKMLGIRDQGKRNGRRNRRTNRRKAFQTSVRAPVASASQFVTRQPVFVDYGSKGVRIRHTEFVTSIQGKVGFTVVMQEKINPGLSGLFPWLSTQASSWEQYKFHSLRFIYKTRTATNEKGSVLLAMDYDSTDNAPTTEKQLLAYDGATENAVWRDEFITANVAAMFPIGPRKYVRSGAVAGDMKTYDVGTIYVGSQGCDNGNDGIGKFFVEYDVELFVPQLDSESPYNGKATVLYFDAEKEVVDHVENIIWDYEVANDGLGLQDKLVLDTGFITLPKGKYLVNVTMSYHAAGSVTTGLMLLYKRRWNGTEFEDAEEIKMSIAQHKTAADAITKEGTLSCQGVLTSAGQDVLNVGVTLRDEGSSPHEVYVDNMVVTILVA